MGVLANFEALNNADLSKVQEKVDALLDKVKAALSTQGKGKTLANATTEEISKAIKDSQLTADDFIEALKAAQRSSL